MPAKKLAFFLAAFSVTFSLTSCTDGVKRDPPAVFPPVWFASINDPNKPDWEILPQERQAGEVILSKRNELGILSNFAATPFELKRDGSHKDE